MVITLHHIVTLYQIIPFMSSYIIHVTYQSLYIIHVHVMLKYQASKDHIYRYINSYYNTSYNTFSQTLHSYSLYMQLTCIFIIHIYIPLAYHTIHNRFLIQDHNFIYITITLTLLLYTCKLCHIYLAY